MFDSAYNKCFGDGYDWEQLAEENEDEGEYGVSDSFQGNRSHNPLIEEEGQINAKFLLQLCKFVAPLVSILCTSMLKANLFGYVHVSKFIMSQYITIIESLRAQLNLVP